MMMMKRSENCHRWRQLVVDWTRFLFLGIVIFPTLVTGFSVSSPPSSNKNVRVIVIGKIIVDEYGAPDLQNPTISIGGGGPQAAWGAAAALAASDETILPNDNNINLPRRQ